MKGRSIALILVFSLIVAQLFTVASGQTPSNGPAPSASIAPAGIEYSVVNGVSTITDFDLNIAGFTIFKVSRSLDSEIRIYEFFPSARLILGPTFSYDIFGMELGAAGLIITMIIYIIAVVVVLRSTRVFLSILIRLLRKFRTILDKNVKRLIIIGKARLHRALGKRFLRAAAASDMQGGTGSSRKIIYDVFISHSSSNKDVADEICLNLESDGIKCWIAPRDIRAGDAYQEAIVNAIDASSIMLLIFSAASNDSPHVIRELNRAVSQRVTIIPFRIENVSPSKGMSYLIGIPQWMEAYQPPLEPHIERLVSRVKSILEGKGRGDEG